MGIRANKNLLLIGSESFVCKDYVSRYGKRYHNIVGLDFPNKSSHIDNYFSVDFRHNKTFGEIKTYLRKLDLSFSNIIFSAGVNYMNDIYGITLSDWENTFNINVKSALFTLKATFEYMSDSSTSIVFVASQNGLVGHEKRVDYGPSKSALIQLSKNLSVDYAQLKEKDIRVNCVSPSYIINDSNREILESYYGKKLLARIPYGKFVTLEDVSETICFLSSEISKAIRGQNIILDYGYTIV